MPEQTTINPRSDFDGSIAKAMPKVQDTVDAYPESVKSTIQEKTLVGGSKRKMPETEYPSSAVSTFVPNISIPAKRSRQLPVRFFFPPPQFPPFFGMPPPFYGMPPPFFPPPFFGMPPPLPRICANGDADGDEKAKGLQSVYVPDGIYYIYGENNLVMNSFDYCRMAAEAYPIKVINRTTLASKGIVSFSSDGQGGGELFMQTENERSIHLLSLLLPYADLDIHRTGEETQFKLFVPPNAENTNDAYAYKCIIYHRGKFVRVQTNGYSVADATDSSKAAVYILRPSQCQEHKYGEWSNKAVSKLALWKYGTPRLTVHDQICSKDLAIRLKGYRNISHLKHQK